MELVCYHVTNARWVVSVMELVCYHVTNARWVVGIMNLFIIMLQMLGGLLV